MSEDVNIIGTLATITNELKNVGKKMDTNHQDLAKRIDDNNVNAMTAMKELKEDIRTNYTLKIELKSEIGNRKTDVDNLRGQLNTGIKSCEEDLVSTNKRIDTIFGLMKGVVVFVLIAVGTAILKLVIYPS